MSRPIAALLQDFEPKNKTTAQTRARVLKQIEETEGVTTALATVVPQIKSQKVTFHFIVGVRIPCSKEF